MAPSRARAGQPNDVVGFGVQSEHAAPEPMKFQRRPLEPEDVLFDVHFCGVCHSDWHTMKNEWNTTKYPIITGHEITGIVTSVGDAVKEFKAGTRVILSPLYNSCRACRACENFEEQYCEKGTTETYNQYDRLPTDIKDPTGPVTQGGYSNAMVVHQRYLFHLPDNLPMDRAAPLVCAGLTVFGMITRFLEDQEKAGKKPNTRRVGIAGIGGLGHMALKICKALGIGTVIALTTTEWKVKHAKETATRALLMKNLAEVEKLEGKLHMVLCTIPFRHDMDPYVNLLQSPGGTAAIVGLLMANTVEFDVLVRKGLKLQGWNTGGTALIQKYLQWTSAMLEKGEDVLPDIESITFEQLAGTRAALLRSECKFRFVIDVRKSLGKKRDAF